MNRHSFILLLLFVLLTGCQVKWDFEIEDFEPQIVVDGWIESGNVATVCLTQTRSLNSNVDSMTLAEIPIRWAKVTVSDGETTEVLTGTLDTNYVPSFIYRGNLLIGEPGKTYTLTVEYSGHTVTASTTIPQPVPLADIQVSRCPDSDSLYQINAYIDDNATEKNFYKFFTRCTQEEKRFYASFLGNIDDAAIGNSKLPIPVYRGKNFIQSSKFIPYYHLEDTVLVKFAHLPQHGFDFWNGYENEVTNGQNPLFPSNTNLKSNILGGLGIWCGYGVSLYPIVIARDVQ